MYLSAIWFCNNTLSFYSLLKSMINSSKINKSGGYVSGNIEYRYNAVDTTKSNNNVSGTSYPTTFWVSDVNARTMARLEGVIMANGSIGTKWYCQNYGADGTEYQKGITIVVDKSGNTSYTITDTGKFISALGPMIKVQTFGSSNITASATSTSYVDISFTVPSGYSYLLSTPCDTGSIGIVIRTLTKLSGNNVRCYYDNWGSSNKTGTIIIYVVFVRTGMV